MPGHNPCCPGGYDCGCETDPNVDLEVTFDGIGNGLCSLCDVLNDTWTLTYQGMTGSGDTAVCNWKYEADIEHCLDFPDDLPRECNGGNGCVTKIVAQVGNDAFTGKWFLRIAIDCITTTGAGNTDWELFQDDKFDCHGFSDLDVPVGEKLPRWGDCILDASTCSVTSIPS